MTENDYRIEILDSEDERIYDLEFLRHQVFHLKTARELIQTSYSIFHIKHHQTIPFALSINSEMVAGCYVTCYNDTLFVDFLFVKEEYHNTGLKIGRLLLGYILNNKHIIEEIIHRQLNNSKLTPNSDKSEHIYQTLGYEYTDETAYMCKIL